MGNTWLKIKIWTKIVVFGIVFLFAVIFVAANSERVKVWPFNSDPGPRLFWVLLGAFFAGVITTLLAKVAFRTIRQITEMKSRGRAAQIERELAQLKADVGGQSSPKEPPIS
jgi:uncharacterized integral membrane protein